MKKFTQIKAAGSLLAVLLAVPGQPRQAAPASQVQVARRFLLAVLGGEYPAAYALLAPEVQAAVPLARFQTVAQPIRQQGQRRGPAIDLYKLGFRLRDHQAPQAFVAFMFKSDTLQARPEVQLDVTFRDSTARRVLGFGLVPAPRVGGKK